VLEVKFKKAMKEKMHVFEWTEEKERAVLGVE